MEACIEHRGKAGPGGRLDMSHGFVHHIRRNQIARDDYDREVKEAKEKQKKRYTVGAPRPKKPDLQVYHPRWKGKSQEAADLGYDGSNNSGSSTEPDQYGTELFCLEFEADGGEITSIIVYENPAGKALHFKLGASITHIVSSYGSTRCEDAELHLLIIDDDAEQLAKKISVQNNLEVNMREALKKRIQEEITKRKAPR